MKGEISYDLVMDDDMAFVEGTYRLRGGEWQVFIFLAKTEPVRTPSFRFTTWRSGVAGVVYRVPAGQALNKRSVRRFLSEALEVEAWSEVRGPDSMTLR